MRLVGHTLLRGFATIALTAVVAASVAGDQLDPIRDVLRRPWTDDDRTRAEVVQSLSSVKNSIPTLFQLYTAEVSLEVTRESSNQTEWWCEPERFSDLYLGALAISPPKQVVAYVQQRAENELSFESRIAIVRVLGALQDKLGTELLLDLSLEFSDLHLRSRTVKEPLERAFSAVFRADSSSLELVEKRTDEFTDELRDLLCRAARTAPCPESVAVLERLMSDGEEIDLELLRVISEMHAERPWLFRDEAKRVIQPFLFDKDWKLRRCAAVALTDLRDFETFSSIALLLDDEQAAVRSAAEWSLQNLSGLSREMSSTEWLDWFDTEIEWWTENEERLCADLRSGDAKLVMAAIRDLTRTSLFRDLAAQALADSLDDSNPALLITVCCALEKLDSRGVVPTLIELLHSRDANVRKVVNRTLVKLTGIERGPNYEDWESYIQS